MLSSQKFVEALIEEGFEGGCGVPCSYFASVLERLNQQKGFRYVDAVNEGNGVALACGAFLGGKKWCVFMQNSGLGNAVNPLTSLAIPYQIPLLLLISWRGDPDHPSEPLHHQLMGEITPQLLTCMGIPWFILNEETLTKALILFRTQKTSVALLIKKETFEQGKGVKSEPAKRFVKPCETRETPGLFEADEILRALVENKDSHSVLVTTTGWTGRSLYALKDDPSHFYMMGSMGCASSIALGVALAAPKRRVIVVDGDGALLMRAGALAVIGAEKPPNLLHLILNNYSYESTGGQKTAAETVDFTGLAQAMGYPDATILSSLEDFAQKIQRGRGALSFIEILTRPVNTPPPRIPLAPSQISQRFQIYVR